MEEKSLSIEDYFNSLHLDQWKISGNKGKGGQASTIEIENIKTGELGVFRTLHSKEAEDIGRFYRELEILVPYNHPNVVKILDYTKDKINHWYISKKGERFETYWAKISDKNSQNADALLSEAIRIISGITEGLIDLHNRGIVHRDIKFRNIIMDGDVPVLIDFGITFILGEERLTPKNKAAANLFSPDPALNFMDEVPPWLDIFLISQLLIWMVSKAPSKNVQRPLDWRWVLYPLFSESNLIKVKALTAICSNYFTSPQNAGELIELIQSIFMNKHSTEDQFEIRKIQEVIQKGKAGQLLNYSDAYSLIESRIPLFTLVCTAFEDGIRDLIKKLQNDLPIKLMRDEPVRNFIKHFYANFKDHLKPAYQTYGMEVTYGEGNPAHFGSSYLIYTRKQIEKQEQFKELENTPIIAFTVNGSNEKLGQQNKTKSYYIVPKQDGQLRLLDSNLNLIVETNIEYILKLIKDAITDPEVWETIYA